MPTPHRRRTALVGAVVIAVIAAACSGDDDAAGTTPTSDVPAGTEAPPTTADEAPAPPSDVIAGASDEELVAIAQTWVDDVSGLDPALADDLVVLGVDRAMATAHVTFGQVRDGLPVREAELVVHVLADGTVQRATNALAAGDTVTDAVPTVAEAVAADTATKAVDGTLSGTPTTTSVWVVDGPGLLLAWEVRFSTSQPMGSWVVLVDAHVGVVLSVAAQRAERRSLGEGVEALGAAGRARRVKVVAQTDDDRCDAGPGPSGCVFLPDPIFASGGEVPGLDEADEWLTAVEFERLDDPDGGHLVGEWVDTEPTDASVDPVAEPDGVWGAGRGESPSFEAAMTYWWVDHTQALFQRLGYTNVRDEPFPFDVLDDDTYDNSFYSPTDEQVYLGTGSDGVNEAEDATTTLHEYGHAVLDDLAPDLIFTEGGGAVHEGFADALAYLVTLEYRQGDHACLFAWPEAGDCLRRIDGDKVYPGDLVGEVHDDGEIYAAFVVSTLGRLLDAEGLELADCAGTDDCNDVRDGLVATLLESASYLTGSAGLPEAGEAFVDAAAAFAAADAFGFDDAAAAAVATVAAERGLAGGGTSGPTDPGDPPDEGVAVDVAISHPYRGDLAVAIVVFDADLERLCEERLPEPDPGDDSDDYRGTFDLTGSDCDGFAPPAPDQQWFLYVQDLAPADVGQIVGFTVYVDGVPYLGRGLPRPIPDDQQLGVAAVAGTERSHAPGDDLGDVPADVAYASVEISHTYRGDLGIELAVVDADGTELCLLPLKEPDSSDPEDDVIGSADVSACAAHLPPGPDRRWVLEVVDSAAQDEGTIEAFSITDVAGTSYAVTGGVPAAIPDDDPRGVRLVLDGSGGDGSMPRPPSPVVDVAITHPWRGDLSVAIGLTDGARLFCEDTVAQPARGDDDDDLVVSAPLDDCALLYPEARGRTWVVSIADVGAQDVGTLDRLTLTGPDGRVLEPARSLPVVIPDNDRTGLVLELTG